MEELEFYKDFFENAPDLFVSVDPATAKVKNCNQTLVRRLGFASKSEVLGKHIFDFYHESCHEKVKTAFQLFMEEGRVENMRLTLRAKDGAEIPVSLSVSALRDKEGNIVGSRSIWRDLSEQVKYERQIAELNEVVEKLKSVRSGDSGQIGQISGDLEKSEPVLSRALNAMEDGVVIANEKGEFIVWNEAGKRIVGIGDTGKPPEEWSETYGVFETDMRTPTPAKDLPLARAISGEPCENRELFLRNADRPEGVFVLVSAHPIFDVNGKCVGGVAVIIDITEKKKLELELEEQRAIAMQSSKLAVLGEMAGGIAHEINNPLAIIVSAAYSVEQLTKKGRYEKIPAMIENIIGTSQRIKTIISGLLKFARADEEQEKKIEPLEDVIEDALSLSREKIKSFCIDLDVQPIPEVFIFCSSVEISQIILNLLNNSIDSVREMEAPWVKMSFYQDKGFLFVRVVDSGSGLSSEAREKAFRPFYTTKPVGSGTGLGLSISQGIAESHGGSLYYEEGAPNTAFILKLPMEASEEKYAA